MKPYQYFETTVFDATGKFSADIAFVPGNGLDINEIADPETLKLKKLGEIRASEAVTYIALMLSGCPVEKISKAFENPGSRVELNNFLVDADAYDMAEYLAYAEIIPYKNSPEILRSLVSMLKDTNPVVSGTAMGIYALQDSPLIYVTVAGGVVLMNVLRDKETMSEITSIIREGIRKAKKILQRRSEEKVD